MSDKQSTKPSAWDRVIEPWWAKLAIGVLMIVLAWWQYVDFSKLESGERESLYIGRSTKVLYNIGGKWLPVGISSVFGAGFIAWGVVQVTRGQS